MAVTRKRVARRKVKRAVQAAKRKVRALKGTGKRPGLITFGRGNAKLDGMGVAVWTFSLPAGWTCPFALACLSKASKDKGEITDGPGVVFRCFAATMESQKSIRDSRWRNLRLLQTALAQGAEEAAALILRSLPDDGAPVRVHVSGDMFSLAYFRAWLLVARMRPSQLFYAYTKAIGHWVALRDTVPDNFILTASYGGTEDHLIQANDLRFARVYSAPSDAEIEALAAADGLEVDHDDSHAARNGPSFALGIHGTQPKGTKQARDWEALRRAKMQARRTALALVA